MTPLRRGVLALGALGMAMGMLAGCSGPTVWEQTFAKAPGAAVMPTVQGASNVRVRSIPWARMQAALAELERAAGASDVHPAEWLPEEKARVKQELLRGLQVSADARSVEVIGRSEFRTTETIRPEGEDGAGLESFARSIGATDVVWSSKVLGRTEKIVERPVTSTSTGTFWGSRQHGNDPWWSDNYTTSSTTWVPVRVPADDTGFVAYFLRSP